MTSLQHILLRPKMLAVIFLLTVLALLLASRFYTRPAPRMMNGNGIRGVHQTMAVFAQNNNTYLPGLNQNGQPSTQPTATQPATQPASQPSTQPASQPATSSWKSKSVWDSPQPTTLDPERARKGHLMLNDKNGSIINSDDFLFSSSATQPSTQPSSYPGPGGYTGSDF